MMTSDQLASVLERRDALRGYLDIDNKRIQLKEEELRTQDPHFWDDPAKAQDKMREVGDLKRWIEDYDKIDTMAEELSLALEYAKEDPELISEEETDKIYASTLEALDDLELRNMLRSEEDQLGALLQINSGAGGTESQDWASMLARMYQRWAEAHGYKVTITNWQDGDEAGIKTCTFEIEGDYAYGYLKSENGVHRLVRVSPYNAQGKRMTSFASVFVVPLVDDRIEVTVDPAKISWDTFRSGGAGGQNVNKVETGVRLRYQYTDPDTGETEEILIENTETRKQQENRANAMRHLKSELYDRELKRRHKMTEEIEGSKMKIEWGSQIRSYVFDDRRVKDHRTDYQTSDVDGVMDGDLDGFIKAFLMEFGASPKDISGH
ncbi:peptide chain release factor 2 [uncultured Porphyromonas sp.]|uniref:peptide chain release factor 2 n=1 Tax=uncultured Porphyromonas sp. TaxID=159274 RepID=UPI0026185786|nr:peptide chain release factor 2 [uncultured Porphyromonas sp.]